MVKTAGLPSTVTAQSAKRSVILMPMPLAATSGFASCLGPRVARALQVTKAPATKRHAGKR